MLPNEIPPLPADAAEQVYALYAVRGVLQWIPTFPALPATGKTTRFVLSSVDGQLKWHPVL
jgi:hypothetical protein